MKLLSRISTGLGIGSFVYLLIQYAKHPADIISVFIISAFTGIMTILFDIEKISYLVALILHFISINIVVFILSKFNGWINDNYSITYLFSSAVIYFISWSIVIIKNRINTKELNRMLKQRKK